MDFHIAVLTITAAINKLSRLQRHILEACLQGWAKNEELAKAAADDQINQANSGILPLDRVKKRIRGNAHANRHEILHICYGLTERRTRWKGRFNSRNPWYGTANASFYRAVKSLERRGLVRRDSGDLSLSELGLKAAKRLSNKEDRILKRQMANHSLAVH
jgi:hypothetical protein